MKVGFMRVTILFLMLEKVGFTNVSIWLYFMYATYNSYFHTSKTMVL